MIHISPALDGEDDDQATWSAVWSGFAGPCVAAMGETIREVATRFSVSPSYVSKVRARLRATGQATPGPQHNHVRPRLEPYYDVLRARVGEQSDATIAELRALDGAGARGCGEPSGDVGDAAPAGFDAEKSVSVRRSRIGRTLPRHAPPGAACNQSSMLRG